MEAESLKEEATKKKSKRLLLVGFVVMALVVGAFAYYTLLRRTRHYTGYEIKHKVERGSSVLNGFFESDGKLISYNNEGISAYGTHGLLLWNSGLSYKTPKVVAEGQFIAVAEVGGKNLSFMNQKSTPVAVTSLQMAGTILELAISEFGQVAVLMQEEKGYLIQIVEPFQKTNPIKAEIKTFTEEDGHALAIGLSKDGAKLVTSFLKYEGNELISTLTFYHFGSTGESTNADRIVGIFPFKETLFGKIDFLGNNAVCAYGDNRIATFSMKYEPSLEKVLGVHGKIRKVAGDETGFALIVSENGTKQTVTPKADREKEVAFLDEEYVSRTEEILFRLSPAGKTLLEKPLPFQGGGLAYKEGELLAYAGGTCLIYNPNGSLKFETKFNETILNMFQSDRGNAYFLINEEHIKIIKLNE